MRIPLKVKHENGVTWIMEYGLNISTLSGVTSTFHIDEDDPLDDVTDAELELVDALWVGEHNSA